MRWDTRRGRGMMAGWAWWHHWVVEDVERGWSSNSGWPPINRTHTTLHNRFTNDIRWTYDELFIICRQNLRRTKRWDAVSCLVKRRGRIKLEQETAITTLFNSTFSSLWHSKATPDPLAFTLPQEHTGNNGVCLTKSAGGKGGYWRWRGSWNQRPPVLLIICWILRCVSHPSSLLSVTLVRAVHWKLSVSEGVNPAYP